MSPCYAQRPYRKQSVRAVMVWLLVLLLSRAHKESVLNPDQNYGSSHLKLLYSIKDLAAKICWWAGQCATVKWLSARFY